MDRSLQDFTEHDGHRHIFRGAEYLGDASGRDDGGRQRGVGGCGGGGARRCGLLRRRRAGELTELVIEHLFQMTADPPFRLLDGAPQARFAFFQSAVLHAACDMFGDRFAFLARFAWFALRRGGFLSGRGTLPLAGGRRGHDFRRHDVGFGRFLTGGAPQKGLDLILHRIARTWPFRGCRSRRSGRRLGFDVRGRRACGGTGRGRLRRRSGCCCCCCGFGLNNWLASELMIMNKKIAICSQSNASRGTVCNMMRTFLAS